MPDAIDHVIHDILADLGILTQRLDEFVNQEPLIFQFSERWKRVVRDMRKDVMKQYDNGKTKIKID